MLWRAASNLDGPSITLHLSMASYRDDSSRVMYPEPDLPRDRKTLRKSMFLSRYDTWLVARNVSPTLLKLLLEEIPSCARRQEVMCGIVEGNWSGMNERESLTGPAKNPRAMINQGNIQVYPIRILCRNHIRLGIVNANVLGGRKVSQSRRSSKAGRVHWHTDHCSRRKEEHGRNLHSVAAEILWVPEGLSEKNTARRMTLN